MQIQRERVRLAGELSTLREYFEAAASDRGVQLTVDCADTLAADVDRTLFQRAISNLISNALAHTPAGGTITLAAGREGSHLRVDVIDTGAGIAPEHLPRLFDRLYRADASRNFTGGNVGLGLSIVRGIAQLHGGKASIESSLGKGTRVTIWFGGASRSNEEIAAPVSRAQDQGTPGAPAGGGRW
jgi:two-component system heavy metal sensor histidine kinase CusS